MMSFVIWLLHLLAYHNHCDSFNYCAATGWILISVIHLGTFDSLTLTLQQYLQQLRPHDRSRRMPRQEDHVCIELVMAWMLVITQIYGYQQQYGNASSEWMVNGVYWCDTRHGDALLMSG